MGRWILGGAVLAAIAAAALLLLGGGGPLVPVPAPVPPAPFRIRPAPAPPKDGPKAPPAPAKASAPGNTLAVKGRVVDDRRFPIGGARVALHRAGEAVLSAVAGADGGFRFEGVPRPAVPWLQAGLLARAPDGRIAAGQANLAAKGPAESDAGLLVVGAAAPLSVRVVDGGAPVPGARVTVGWSYSWPLEAVAGEDGIARFDALPRQAVSLLARAGDPARAGRGEVALQGDPPMPVEVPLSPARTIEVTVVEKGTGRPVPGAVFKMRRQVRSPGMVMSTDPGPLPPVAPTDAEGRTRIEGTCAADWLSLDEASAPGFIPNIRTGTTVKPGQVEARLELLGVRTLRIPVVAGEAPVPPDGASLRLDPDPNSGQPAPAGPAVMEGTVLVIEKASVESVRCLLTAPDGSRAKAWADAEKIPESISFRPPRTIAITARNPDGTPAAAIPFLLRDLGNNAVAEMKSTDGEGRLVFEGLHNDWQVQVVRLEDAANPWGGEVVGHVDLKKGDGTLEVVVPAKRTFTARVTVDGAPRLVPQMFVSLGNFATNRFEENPERGEVRFEVPLDPAAKSVVLTLGAHPYLPATATVGSLPGTGPIPVEFALRSGGVLLVEVKAPKDTSYRLNLQRWDEARSLWIAANVPGAMAGPGLFPGPDGVARAEPLVEGRYRVVEASTGIPSETVEVRAGGEPARLSIDVSRQGYAKGRILLPEGAKMAEVRILVRGAGSEAKAPTGGFDDMSARAQADGNFMVRVPGDRAVTVVPWHPTLVPAAEGGSVEVTEPREGLVLRLVQGARATFRLDPSPADPKWAEAMKRRVLLFAGDPSGDPVSEHVALQEGDLFAFGGFKPGTWTLWIDPANGYAPAVVRGAVLAEGGTDLGTVALSEGSRLRVKVLVKEGAALQRVSVWASREDAPRYFRGTNSNGEETVVVPGLGPGRFRITASANAGRPGKATIDEIRELDGTNDLELTMDLR